MAHDRALMVITSSFPINDDGSEAAGSFVIDLVKELSLSAPVRVVAPGQKKSIERLPAGVVVYRYAAPNRPLSTLRIWNPMDAFHILRTLIAGRAATMEAAADRNVRQCIALWAFPSGYWARIASRKLDIPYTVWMLGSDIWSLGRIRILRPVLRTIIRRASRRFADGLQLATDAESIAGINVDFLPTMRAITIPRGLSPPKDGPPYRLLFLGRWHLNKGVDLLLEALRMLDDEDWSRIREVRILGGGSLEKLIRSEGDTLRKDGRPVFIGGFVPKSEAVSEIAEADYIIIPSRIESIPLVFSDAMKLRRPVMATSVGDFASLYRQAPFGILAESANSESIRDALKRILRKSPREFDAGVAWHASQFDIREVARTILRDTT